MRLSEILPMIYAPKGVSSMLAGVMSGDFSPIRDQNAIGASLQEARERKRKAVFAMENVQSDWAYWGYMGDVAYWSAVTNLLEAAELVGPDNLPDVPLPRLDGVVMDVQANLEDFGYNVLKRAKEAATAKRSEASRSEE